MTRVVKLYRGGRLYEPAATAYTTAALLRGADVVVVDAATGEDVTAKVLGRG